MNYLAFDFGGTFVKGALIKDDVILERWKDKAPLASVEQFSNYIMECYNRYSGKAEGIAISMPGIIDVKSGYALKAGSYKALAKTNIYDLLKDIPVKTAVENDGKAATLAELYAGNLKGVQTGAVITIGTGLGGGIVQEGKLQRGSHYAAGELTGFLLEPGNYSMAGSAALNCGMTAFLLKVAEARNMDPAEFEVSDNFVSGHKTVEKKYGGREVLQWVEQNDETVKKVYHEWLEKLVMIILNLQIILDTEVILIGGGISQNQMFIDDLQAEYRKACEGLSIYRRFNSRVEACKFREDANLLGAVYNFKSLYE